MPPSPQCSVFPKATRNSSVPKIEEHRAHPANTLLSRIANTRHDSGELLSMEQALDKPDEIDLGRPQITRHMSFGSGIHHCAGVHLARLEIKLALQSLLDRYASIRLPDHFTAQFDATFHIRQLTALPLISGS